MTNEEIRTDQERHFLGQNLGRLEGAFNPTPKIDEWAVLRAENARLREDLEKLEKAK